MKQRWYGDLISSRRCKPNPCSKRHLIALMMLTAAEPIKAQTVDLNENPIPLSDDSNQTGDIVKLLTSQRLNQPTSGWLIGFDLSHMISSNAYANNNIALALRTPATSDRITEMSTFANASIHLTSRENLVTDIQFGHRRYSNLRALSFSHLNTSISVQTIRFYPAILSLAYSCSAEFDAERNIYKACGPDLRVRTASPRRKLGVVLDGGAFLRNGRETRFEQYKGARGGIAIVANGEKWSGLLATQYFLRKFDGGYGRLLNSDDRQDHRVSVTTGVERRVGPLLRIGFQASGLVNWSNYDEFRYTDFSFGPTLRVGFGA